MQIKTYVTGPIQVNTYVLKDEDSKEAVLIDVGGSFETIKKDLDKDGYSIKYILNTHGHFDHVLGELEVQQNYPNIPIYINKDDVSHFSRLEQEMQMFGFSTSVPPLNPTLFIDEETQLSIGNHKIKVLSTPGHSKGSLTFYVDNKLFTGDALFYRSIGRTDFYDGDFDELITSIKEKIFIFPDDTTVYPGHGPSTTILDEKKYNQYLK
jgi:glyoxylase-like metal-dependent hydrolase (beta-lactamase superfamily II)